MPEDDENEYDPSKDGPEAQNYREQNQEELRLERTIDRLLRSLTPEDVHRHLFTFEEMWTYNLKHKRVPKPPRKI